MAYPEFKPEEVPQSIANVNEVYRYAKGERALPLQNLQLERKYVSALKQYFEYCQQALTDSAVIALIERGRVGTYGPNSNYAEILKQVEGVRQISTHAHLLIAESNPRLVLSDGYSWLVKEGENETTIRTDWVNQVIARYPSADGFEDWVFGARQTEGYDKRTEIYGFRTMGPSDLLLPNIMPYFVRGIGSTFGSLRRQAEFEVAEKFDGIKDIDRIKAITQGFGEANAILDKVFNPEVATKQPAKRGRRPSAS